MVLAWSNVSFEVQPGEVFGIIGHNGAGKSTLLKLLSRITRPSRGSMAIRGRVGSLLEIGTGMHLELTGRENIYLNGTILGMRRADIKRKFDEIVAFSEIERFLDTPVKHYSSGMFVRLAFAVAAHLEPEILLVDEVLAVGDAAFQKKCLGKMGDAAVSGRTILFVSHNMGAVRRLCNRALRLTSGAIEDIGMADAVVDRYILATSRVERQEDIREKIARLPIDPVFRLLNVSITQDGKTPVGVLNGRVFQISIRYQVFEPTQGLRIYVNLCDENGDLLIESFDDELESSPRIKRPGEYLAVVEFPANLLVVREYSLSIHAMIHNDRSLLGNGLPIALRVESTSSINSAYAPDPIRGKLLPSMRWSTQFLSS